MNQRIPFFTGSQAYGAPTQTSNTDIVVLMGEALETYPGVRSLCIGTLRIILVSLPEEYDAWHAATQRMIEWRNQGWAVPKAQAILEIDKEHELRDLTSLRANLRAKTGTPVINQPL
jgi:hypothetical protein|tara:strand:+ start:4428 stop:4778 length:351 start_codon:yes stop_codon:yes gene_type:complete